MEIFYKFDKNFLSLRIMKRLNLFSLLGIIAILLSSCTSYIDDSKMNIQEPAAKPIWISATDSILTPSDASIVALLEMGGNTATKSGSDGIEDVVPIYGDEGEVIMYAVNFKAGGYTIISAIKEYYPILAKIETGRYSDDIYSTGASVLMREYKEGIKYARTLPEESLEPVRALWAKYEEPHAGQWMATKSNDPLTSLISESIREWQEQGLSYTFLNEGPPKEIPYDVYQRFVDYAAAFSNPNYDHLVNCVIIGERTNLWIEITPELLTTKWAQGYPYNFSIPDGCLVGCGGVATAQIMAYHRFPARPDWNAIHAGVNPALGNFIYEVADGIDTQFGHTDSPSYTVDVKSYLSSKGYNVKHISHSATQVKNSLGNDRPVFMRGNADGEDSGHAWVCDGYARKLYQVKYTLLVLSYDEPLQFEPCMEPYMHYGPEYELFHMNWGWGGLHNGYYMELEWPSGHNYSSNRQDLVNICPK